MARPKGLAQSIYRLSFVLVLAIADIDAAAI
jgi:hypothetical protein